jgi:hypothetical protein
LRHTTKIWKLNIPLQYLYIWFCWILRKVPAILHLGAGSNSVPTSTNGI